MSHASLRRSNTFKIFLRLLQRDLRVFRHDIFDYIINAIIWPTQMVVAFGYIMPIMGMNPAYGAFLVGGNTMFKCLYESYFLASSAVADLNSHRSLEFEYTLPVPAWVILLKNATYFLIRSFVLNSVVLTVSLIALMNTYDPSIINIGQFFIIFTLSSIFFAFFSLWLTGWVRNQLAFENAWSRFFDPMMFWGCYWFSWKTLHSFLPGLAYACLANPITFAMESMRASMLGQQDYLPFWPCACIFAGLTVIMGAVAYLSMRKRLDFVD